MTFDEFKNVDLRLGKVVSAERVEGSEKLLKLQSLAIDVFVPGWLNSQSL